MDIMADRENSEIFHAHVDHDLSIIYSNMNARVQQSPWGSSCHGQKAAPASQPLVNTRNGEKLGKRTSTQGPNENAKKSKIVLVDLESEDTKENSSINDSISSSADTSTKDQPNNTSILFKLAKLLAKHIKDNERLLLNGLLKKYHIALVQENVIKVEWKKEYKSKRKYYGTFHPDFVKGENLSDSAKKLKYYLDEALEGNPVLGTIKLKLSDKFGKKFRFDENPQINDLDELLADLEPNISRSLLMPDEQVLIRNTPILKHNIQKLAGHVFMKMKDSVVFTEDFLNIQKKLNGNLDDLRIGIIKQVTELQTDKKFSDLCKSKFRIHNFADTESPDVEMKLPNEDFLENSSNFTYEAQNITKKMQHVSAKEIHNNFNNVINDSFSQITFNQETLGTITSCLINMSNKQVNFIDTECPAFHIRKVLQIVQGIPMYSEANRWIFIKFRDFLDQSYSILEKFESTSTHLLLIEHSSSSDTIEGIDKICLKLEYIVQNCSRDNPKKLLVIGNTKDLHALFKFKCIVDEKCVNIVSQLTEESQSDLLQKIQVNLYNRQIKFDELVMDKQALVNIVSTPQLLEQLLVGGFVIGCSEYQRQRSYYNTEFIDEKALPGKSRAVIVSGKSGSGKSICLQKLEDRLIKSSKLTWVVDIHLDKTDVIKKLEEQSFEESKNPIDFLIELLGYQGLQKQMLVACVVGELRLKLVLFFYGFGERLLYSSKNCKKTVLNILKELQLARGDINIYVTCESQSRKYLERELHVHALELDPFTPKKKYEFVVECLRDYPNSNKVDLPKRAVHLLQSYENKKCTHLMDTPLKLKMLVHIHWPELISDNPSPTCDTPRDLCEFYERFIKSCNLDDITSQMLIRLSLRRLLTSSERKSLDLDEMQPLDEEQMVENRNSLLMHLTFAEYSVAKWLSDHLSDKKIKSAILQCIERLIVVTSSVFFYTIVQYSAEFQGHGWNQKGRLELARSVIKKDLVNWFSVMLQRQFLDNVLTQMLLRYAVKNNKLEMVRILINHYRRSNANLIEFVNSKSAEKCKSALTVALETKNISMACELMVAGANINELKPEFQQKVLRCILGEIFKGQSHCNHVSLVEKFILLESHVVIESLETDREFEKLFTFFLDKGRMETVNCLLRALHDGTVVKPRLLSTSFDVINANRNIKDEDRLEMSKVLLEKLDGSLEKHVNSVLEAALESNHPRSFEYFVDRYPGRYIGFLKNVLLHNRFKALEFLLHNKLSEKLRLPSGTALNLALDQSNVNPRVLKLLLDHGDLDSVNNPKAENPLCRALKRNLNPRLVRYLAKKRSDLLNTEDTDGMFPWCYVLLDSDSDTCKYSATDQLDLMTYFKSKAKLELPSNKARQSFVFDKRRQEIERKLDFLWGSKKETVPHLHKAVQANDNSWLTFLLVHGANVDVREPECDESALHLAVKLKHRDMVERLLQHGAMFNATDKKGKTPLDYALNYEIESVLKEVAKYFDGNDLYAMLKKRSDKIEHLLQPRAMFEPTDKKGKKERKAKKAPLDYARNPEIKSVPQKVAKYFDKNDFYAMLKKEAKFFNCRDRKGRTLLHVAADVDDAKAILILMKFSRKCQKFCPDQPFLDVNAKDLGGDTPLHVACRKGYHDVVHNLFSLGAVFEMVNENGESPQSLAQGCQKNICLFKSVANMFDALHCNERETAKSLIEKNRFIINVKDSKGMTVLHYIVQQKDDDLLKFLLNLGSNVHFSLVDLTGRTVLHVAAEVDNLPAAKLFLKLGLSLDTKDNKGRRAFECGLPDSKCVKMLKDIYELLNDIHSDKPQILVNERPENLEKYLNQLDTLYQIEPYVVLNAKTSPDYMNSLAHQAAIYNYRGVLENLFRHGAALPRNIYDIGKALECKNLMRKIYNVLVNISVHNWGNLDEKIIVNCRDFLGETLLYKAVKEKKLQEIRWLLKRGANPFDATIKNYSALSAAERMQERSPEIFNLLKKANRDTVRKDGP